ncbi:MAG: tRNA (adenosine(37)-N6)-dimethylallyltransferase MiaA [Candidatus Gastranaerophilaceae bacterium]|jgi:tRNA dimethylallyltransferase
MRNTAKVITLVGPTASGKTSLSVKLSQIIDSEIVSADSRLVYKDFNIGTAKPTLGEMQGIPHHLIDIIDPNEDFSAGIYKDKAEEAIHDIIKRQKTPVIAGGTGFYIKALLEGLDMPRLNPDNEYRLELEQLAQEKGREFLYNMLREKDPTICEKLHPNDKFRVIRALEVIKILGIPMSEAQKQSQPKYNTIYFGLTTRNREFLYERVNKRVDIMLEQGLIDEVKALINKHGRTVSMLKTLGYKEICEYLDGNLSFEAAVELIKKNTRNFAKRQLTWFRANPQIHWFYIDEMPEEEILQQIVEIIPVTYQ